LADSQQLPERRSEPRLATTPRCAGRESTLELVDWTLKVIDEGAGDPESPMQRGPMDALTATLAMLGGAAAGAIAMDADERGATRSPTE
jgi:hypothetical protein